MYKIECYCNKERARTHEQLCKMCQLDEIAKRLDATIQKKKKKKMEKSGEKTSHRMKNRRVDSRAYSVIVCLSQKSRCFSMSSWSYARLCSFQITTNSCCNVNKLEYTAIIQGESQNSEEKKTTALSNNYLSIRCSSEIHSINALR